MVPLEDPIHLRQLIKGGNRILTDQVTESTPQRTAYILDLLMGQGMILI